jgi:hypothetical protein
MSTKPIDIISIKMEMYDEKDCCACCGEYSGSWGIRVGKRHKRKAG